MAAAPRGTACVPTLRYLQSKRENITRKNCNHSHANPKNVQKNQKISRVAFLFIFIFFTVTLKTIGVDGSPASPSGLGVCVCPLFTFRGGIDKATSVIRAYVGAEYVHMQTYIQYTATVQEVYTGNLTKGIQIPIFTPSYGTSGCSLPLRVPAIWLIALNSSQYFDKCSITAPWAVLDAEEIRQLEKRFLSKFEGDYRGWLIAFLFAALIFILGTIIFFVTLACWCKKRRNLEEHMAKTEIERAEAHAEMEQGEESEGGTGQAVGVYGSSSVRMNPPSRAAPQLQRQQPTGVTTAKTVWSPSASPRPTPHAATTGQIKAYQSKGQPVAFGGNPSKSAPNAQKYQHKSKAPPPALDGRMSAGGAPGSPILNSSKASLYSATPPHAGANPPGSSPQAAGRDRMRRLSYV